MLVRVALGAATVVVGFLGGAQLHQVVASTDDPRPTLRAVDPRAHEPEVVLEDCPPQASAPPYPENDRGMTYGSGTGIDEDDPGPDLVAARDADGRCGFIRSADRERGHDIPLYAQDGVTVIGELHLDGGRVLTSPAPEPSRSTP